jgi:AcrR family transcriptional regulator
MKRPLLVVLLLVLVGAAKLPPRTQIDWREKRLVTVGAAAADLRAPGPDIARVTAERQAQARAGEQLRTAIAKLTAVAASDERVAKLAGSAHTKVHYFSDGSVEVELTLPLAAIEKALGVEVKK